MLARRLGRLRRVSASFSSRRDAITTVDVSVALSTHNGARFVAEQVRSILQQTVVPREIVVGDDASSDETVAIVEATVARFRREMPSLDVDVRVIRRPQPLGVTGNFEQTIAACTSRFIALCDQDDVWPTGRLARLVSIFDDDAVELVHTDARLIDAADADTGLLLLDALEATADERAALARGDAFRVLLRRNLVTGATVVLRRSLAEAATPFPAGWLHDEWLAAVAAARGSLRLIDEPWLDYRQHGANEVGASAPTWSRRWAKLREPRGPRAARLIARSRALVDYLERFGADTSLLIEAQAKLAHEEWRARLPRWRLLRLPAVLWTAARGRYGRFNRGAIDVVRDLVQPAD